MLTGIPSGLTANEIEVIISDGPADEAQAARTAVDSDGFLYDTESGEVLGRAGLAPRFKVDSEEAAEFTLQIRSEIEGKIAGLAARKTAVVAMLDSLIADQRRRLSWWEWRFSSSLITFARSVLTGKNRTAKFAWGQVAFRKAPGTHVIINDEEALRFVETWAPDKVKVVRTVNVTAVKAALAAARAACPDEEIDMSFLRVTGEDENVSITTGIQLEPKR